MGVRRRGGGCSWNWGVVGYLDAPFFLSPSLHPLILRLLRSYHGLLLFLSRFGTVNTDCGLFLFLSPFFSLKRMEERESETSCSCLNDNNSVNVLYLYIKL